MSKNRSIAIVTIIVICVLGYFSVRQAEIHTHTVSVSQVLAIPEGYIRLLQWQEHGALKIQVNDVAWLVDSETYKASPADDYIFSSRLPTPTQFNTPAFSAHLGLSAGEEIIAASPSGKKFIFLTESDKHLDNGELSRLPTDRLLGIVSQDQKKYLQSITSCGRDVVSWTKAESAFVIQNTCVFRKAWVYSDLQDSLIALDGKGGFTELFGFSDDDEYLLYSVHSAQSGLYALNLSSLTLQQLKDISYAQSVGWLGLDEALFVYNNAHESPAAEAYAVGIYNLSQNTYQTILTTENKRIEWAELSDDKQKLAFTTIIEPFQKSQLWMVDLSLVD